MKKVQATKALIIAASVGALPAFADLSTVTIDTSTIVAFMTGTVITALLAVGVAKWGVAAVGMSIKWIKGAIFG